MATPKECEVCLVPKTLIPLFCGHEFCAVCLREWGKRSATCPLCRSHLVTEVAPKVVAGADHGSPVLLAIVSRHSLFRLYYYPTRWCPCIPSATPKPRSVKPHLIQRGAPTPSVKGLRGVSGYLLRIDDDDALAQVIVTNADHIEHRRPPPLYVMNWDDRSDPVPAKIHRVYMLPPATEAR